MMLPRLLLLVVLCAVGFSSGEIVKRLAIWEVHRVQYAEDHCPASSEEDTPVTAQVFEKVLQNAGVQQVIDSLRPLSDNFQTADETRLTSMYTYLVCALDSLDAGVIQTIVNGIEVVCTGDEDYATPTGMARCIISICDEIADLITTMNGYENTPEHMADVAETYLRLEMALIELQKAVGKLQEQLMSKRALATSTDEDIMLGLYKLLKRELETRTRTEPSLESLVESCPGAATIAAELTDNTPVDPALWFSIIRDSNILSTMGDLKEQVQAFLDGTGKAAETATYLGVARNTVICDLAPLYKLLYHTLGGGLDLDNPSAINSCMAATFSRLDDSYAEVQALNRPPFEDLAVAIMQVWEALSHLAEGARNLLKLRSQTKRDMFSVMRRMKNLA